MPDSSSAAASPTAFTPFAPEAHEPPLKDVTFARLAPRAEPEPPVEHGIDLSGQAKIVFAAGRGKAGKTTLLRWYTEMSLQQGGAPILADIDPSHATLSTYFNDVARPETDHPAGVARWLQELIEHCAATRASAIVDLGGGDTTLRTLATEMPGLVAALALVGGFAYATGFASGRAQAASAAHTISAALAASPAAAAAWAPLMADNDPVQALAACQKVVATDAHGRRYCAMPVWLDPPPAPGP